MTRTDRGGSPPPARTLALTVLTEVESGRRLDVAFEASGASDSPERGWIRTLTYGALRLRGRIDHVLSRYSRTPLSELDPPVRTVLRMGAYQILEMGGVPGYAAVSESVEQIKATRSRGAAGLVNAVLRRVASEVPGETSFPSPETDLEGYLATWGSHPEWLVRRWIRAFGPEGARRLVEADNQEPELFVRPIGVSPDEAVAALAEDGLEAVAVGVAGSVRLHAGTDPGRALQRVRGVVQDPAASLVVDYVSPPAGSLIADLCAAPGGKALALTEAGGRVVAADRSPIRLRRVVQGVERLGAAVWVVAADARHPPISSADVVLVDAPCSGTGTLRRHPDGRWRVVEEDIGRLARVQRSILDAASSAVPPGGLLVYATCALEPEENWGQVKGFLQRHPDFRIEPGAVPSRFLDLRGCLAVVPGETGFDGAFAARLRRDPA